MRNATMDREIFTPEEERDAHFAAMQWFEAQQMSGRELFTHKELMDGFSWHGHHLRLTHQSQGIWKPQEFKAALTFKTAAITPGKEAPYADRIDDSGLLRYKFSATIKWANDAMKVAAAENYPLAWLVGVKPTKQSTLYYYPRFPAYVVDIDNRNAEFIIAINEMTPPTSDHRNSGQIEKKYVSRWTRARIHQHDFREHVLSAYQISCAVCDLPHAQLLEASHIIADSRESGVPEVSNGLALCRLHHTAYDRHLLGIDADRRIHVATRAKRIETVHLQTGLLPFEGRSLTHVPAAKQMRPDGDRLAEHFKEFLQTEEQTVG